MSNHEVEQTYTITAISGNNIRWRLVVGPSTKQRSRLSPCEETHCLQVIVELTSPAVPEQLEFEF